MGEVFINPCSPLLWIASRVLMFFKVTLYHTYVHIRYFYTKFCVHTIHCNWLDILAYFVYVLHLPYVSRIYLFRTNGLCSWNFSLGILVYIIFLVVLLLVWLLIMFNFSYICLEVCMLCTICIDIDLVIMD